MVQWSADRRSYVSAKIIPGYGTLVYMACTDKPDLGWDEKGFAQFDDILDVPNLMSLGGQEHPTQCPAPQRNVNFEPCASSSILLLPSGQPAVTVTSPSGEKYPSPPVTNAPPQFAMPRAQQPLQQKPDGASLTVPQPSSGPGTGQTGQP